MEKGEIDIMKYRTFVEIMKEQIQEYLGVKYQVQIVTNIKFNGIEKTGISIEKKGELDQAVPVLYLEECFERYLQGETFAECVEEICVFYEEQKGKEGKIMAEIEKIEKGKNWKSIQNRIYPILLSKKENENLKNKYCYQEYLDFLVLYVIRVTNIGIGTIKITKQMIKSWGVQKKEVHWKALENLRTDGYQIKGIRNILKENFSEMQEVKEDREEEEFMYVLTNESKYFGAAGIFLCAEIFQKIVGKKNFYILPSSIHELILIEDNGKYDSCLLNNMVREVNEAQVVEEERLSNHIYYFDWKTKQIYTDEKSVLNLSTVNLTLKQRRCQNCISLIEQEGIWCCDEVQDPIEEIECCPEGVEILESNIKK